MARSDRCCMSLLWFEELIKCLGKRLLSFWVPINIDDMICHDMTVLLGIQDEAKDSGQRRSPIPFASHQAILKLLPRSLVQAG